MSSRLWRFFCVKPLNIRTWRAMNYKFINLLSYGIFIPACIGIFHFKRIECAYRPFILQLVFGSINEIVSSILIYHGYSNSINSNLFYLFDAVLILFLFRNFTLFENNFNIFLFLVLTFLTGWVVEVFFFSYANQFCSYFVIFYSFCVVIMSINMLNKMFLKETKSLQHPLFLICIGFVFFYTYSLLIEIFWLYGLNATQEFRVNVYRILAYINFAVNILFTIAVIWMLRKRESLLP